MGGRGGGCTLHRSIRGGTALSSNPLPFVVILCVVCVCLFCCKPNYCNSVSRYLISTDAIGVNNG